MNPLISSALALIISFALVETVARDFKDDNNVIVELDGGEETQVTNSFQDDNGARSRKRRADLEIRRNFIGTMNQNAPVIHNTMTQHARLKQAMSQPGKIQTCIFSPPPGQEYCLATEDSHNSVQALKLLSYAAQSEAEAGTDSEDYEGAEDDADNNKIQKLSGSGRPAEYVPRPKPRPTGSGRPAEYVPRPKPRPTGSGRPAEYVPRPKPRPTGQQRPRYQKPVVYEHPEQIPAEYEYPHQIPLGYEHPQQRPAGHGHQPRKPTVTEYSPRPKTPIGNKPPQQRPAGHGHPQQRPAGHGHQPRKPTEYSSRPKRPIVYKPYEYYPQASSSAKQPPRPRQNNAIQRLVGVKTYLGDDGDNGDDPES